MSFAGFSAKEVAPWCVWREVYANPNIIILIKSAPSPSSLISIWILDIWLPRNREFTSETGTSTLKLLDESCTVGQACPLERGLRWVGEQGFAWWVESQRMSAHRGGSCCKQPEQRVWLGAGQTHDSAGHRNWEQSHP